MERRILVDNCDDRTAPPVLGHADALDARMLAEEASLALPLFKDRCPGKEHDVAAGFVAAGWNALGRAQRAQGVTPPDEPLRVKAADRLVAEAKDDGLTLPTLADATDYWLGTIQVKGQDELTACQK